MGLLGGGQRDLIVALPEHAKRWDITMVTLNAPDLLVDKCRELDIELITPPQPWQEPRGGLKEITAASGRSARKAWKRLLPSLKEPLQQADAAFVIISVGGLEVLELIPRSLPLYAFILERNKGIYDDVSHRNMDGSFKRPMWMNNLALSYLRRWDKKWHRMLWNRPNTIISANTPTSARKLASAHNWPTLKSWIAGRPEFRDGEKRPAGVGVLWPAIDPHAWPLEPTTDELEAWGHFERKPATPYLLTIGSACFMKGSFEALTVAQASSMTLVHVGGGETEDMKKKATEMGVELIIMPRIDEFEIVSLVRNAHALIAIARTEGFGLTPMEAVMVNTPALVVDDAGFTHTITDGLNGRRLPWPNNPDSIQKWVEAIEQSGEESNREQWSKAGRQRIFERFSSNHQAEGLARGLATLDVQVELTDLEILPGLDPA
jgi:glycosyltransferase involved in cell wall biosynthesis